MRDASRRTKKYSSKLSGDVSRLRLQRYGKMQRQLFKQSLPKQVEVERQVKAYMSNMGIGAIYANYYILFAKNMLNPHPQECDIEFCKWAARQLSWYHLRNIGRGIFHRRLNLTVNATVPSTSIYLPFSEGDGIITQDRSGNGYDGNLNPGAASIVDESFTSDWDVWVQLAHTNITPGTSVVTDDPPGLTYTEGVDYNMDNPGGRIMVLSTGGMADATGFLIDYDYSDSYPTWSTDGLLGNCLLYDGVDDYVDLGDEDAYSLVTTGELTIMFWVRANRVSLDTYDFIAGKGSVGNYEWDLRLFLTDPNTVGLFVWQLDGGDSVSVSASGALPLNEWTLVTATMTYSGGNVLVNIYTDGVFRNTANKNFPVANGTDTLKIGTRAITVNRFFSGNIDEFRIFNRVITATEILNIYNAEKPFHH